MWRYQQRFQILAQGAAQRLFGELDRNLEPKVFLVGILTQEIANRELICLEPEPAECGYELAIFDGLIAQAEELVTIDEELEVVDGDPRIQASQNSAVRLRALKDAVQQALRAEDVAREVITFCSWPTFVEGYQVLVVLQF